MYLGSWAIDDVLTFSVNTHSFSTGVATNADSVPTYRVYEDNTQTPILTGSMSAFDPGNAVGQYVAQITLSAASGFEVGKTYTIRISATVGGVTGACVRTFQMGAKVNTTLIAGTAQTARDIGNALPAAAPDASGGLPTTTTLNSRTLPTASYALQSSLDAHLPMAVKRNQSLPAFTFVMLDSADHVTPKAGLTVTARRKLDGGAWGACTNPVTFDATAPVPTYMIDLAAADLNGAVVTLSFTAIGADPLQIMILTQA
jgi:hypothetical protein